MKTSLTKSNPECDYSFDQLYHAAFGKKLDKKDRLILQNLDQKEVNHLVKKWAKKAGWTTIQRTGNDGLMYLAFYPKN